MRPAEGANNMELPPCDQEITEEEFADFYTPKLILFLSADLVGSTALKQKKRKRNLKEGIYIPDTKDWAEAIQLFYSRLTSVFYQTWNNNCNGNSEDAKTRLFGSEPILWKTIGDELIFRKHISRQDQVFKTIHCFIEAVRETTKTLREKMGNEHLEIKCTGWIAEFPIQNKVLLGGQFTDIENFDPEMKGNLLRSLNGYEKRAVGSGLEIDFVGPAIDIGFRLAKISTSRKFAISIDTAYLYLGFSNYSASDEADIFPIRFERSVRLEGVMGGVPYPIFWIDMGEEGSTDRLEDELLSHGKSFKTTDARDALKFCEAFYAERRNYVDRPFIYEEFSFLEKNKRKNPPTWHREFIERSRENYKFQKTML